MDQPKDAQFRGHTPPRKRRRQNPISCSFCREKKLKCDRQSPCSNCSFRSLLCSNQSKYHDQNGAEVPQYSGNDAVLERLRLLERIVLDRETRLPSGGNRPRPALADDPQTSAGPWRSPTTPIPAPVQVAPRRQEHPDTHPTPSSEYAETVQSLEGTGLRRDPWLSSDTVNPEVRVSTVQYIAHLDSDPTQRELFVHKSAIPCALPSKEEAILLLNHYRDHLEDLQHLLHIPTVQEHLESCYTDLSRGQPLNSSVLLLLLSIFASASILISHHPGAKTPPFSQSDGNRLSTYWTGCALEIMKILHNTSCNTLEDIQATILLAFLLLNTEGFSARMHSFFAVIIARGRDLLLHKIDAAGSSGSRNAIDTEIRRRVWWYIVTVDWVLSLSGGPQEGTYSVQPHQMAVNMPRNIDDKDLIYTNPPINHPLSEPTTMSYYVQRIKLAHLCREVVDLVPISMRDTSTVDYQQVIALDQRFARFLQELPEFLRNDEQSIQQSEQVVVRYPQMRVQRQTLSMLAKSKRCKLHQPFLIRGSANTLYSHSRNISLQSARAVLEEKRRADSLDMNRHSCDGYILGGYMIYYTFMATIVLVMDLCFNKKSYPNKSMSDNVDNENDEARVTKAEVMEACSSLNRDQSATGMGTAYLASLMDVLRKYKVKLRPLNPQCIENTTTIQPRTNNNITHQIPSLHAHIPSYTFANPTQNLTQATSIPVSSTPTLQRSVLTNTNNNTTTGTVDTDCFSNLNLKLKSHANDLSLNDHGIAGSIAPADPQGCLADFDDIWNDYVELAPNLDMSYWDSLFSDLGPGMA